MVKISTPSADAEALKVATACALYKQPVSLVGLSRQRATSALYKQLTGGLFPVIEIEDGKVLFDANALVRFLAKEKPAAGLEWTEWEATCLRPAIASGSAASIKSALQRAEHALASHKFLSGASCGSADVIAWSTLHLALAAVSAAGPKVSAWLAAVGGTDAAKAGLKAFDDLKTQLAALGPRKPQAGRRNVLVTSALPYVNNVPHLGNIIGCVLSADVFARYCRLRGYNVIYMCGTDEYGTATETKAQEMGVSPKQICDHYHAIHRDIYQWFDIAFDNFGRTSHPKQTVIAQDIFKKLEAKKLLLEQSMEQLFCDKGCNKFLADRFAEGTCPFCNYADARGDQCDACGKLMNPAELKNPRCKTCGKPPVLRSTQHLFLDLPTISPRLKEWIDSASVKGFWSANSLQLTQAWIRDGLKPRCITRDLKWGIPVPNERFQDKVLYVWFDAPIGYISITADYTEDWQKWWQSPEEVELFQFMGKDNVPFHTVIFPSCLLGTGEGWTKLHHISTTEYLNYEEGKFSKSRGVGVFGDDAKHTGIPSEVWRYYLLVNRPEQSDTQFAWTDFAAKNNNELLANLGNFINRILAFVASRFDSTVPALGPLAPEDQKLVDDVAKEVQDYVAHLEKVRIKDGLRIAMNVSRLGNGYMQELKPWVLVKENMPRAQTVVALCTNVVRLLAVLLEPYMPAFSRNVFTQLGLPELAGSEELRLDPGAPLGSYLAAGHRIGKPSPLFRAIGEDEVKALRSRFAGKQN
eukprot:tig00020614_g12135.t1